MNMVDKCESENVEKLLEEEENFIPGNREKFTREENLSKNTFKDMSLIEKYKYITSNITVEPLVLCYIMPSVLAQLATQNLNLEKACRVNMNYGDLICDSLRDRDIGNYTLEEENVQKLVARMAGWKTVVQSIFPCILVLFWGSWSDRHRRRKPCIIMPIFGECLTAIGLLLCTYFDRWPMEFTGFTESFFPAIAGGWSISFMGLFSYIADISTEEQRTFRIGIMTLCCTISIPLGMAFSGILLKWLGMYGIYSIAVALYIVALLYGIFYVKEPKYEHEIKADGNVTKKGVIADFFDTKHIVDCLNVAFKKGPNQRRLRVIMLIIVWMVVFGPMSAEMTVVYLFSRIRFNWSEVEFSMFLTYGVILQLIGSAFTIGVLSKYLKLNDFSIGVMSCTSKILSGFVYAFAVTNWQMYMGAVVEILSGTSFISMRSIASKLVSSNEIGKINSLFGVAEGLMTLLYAPMYTSIYSATIKVLPGAFFLIGSALTIPAVFIFWWMYNVHKRATANVEKDDNLPKLSDDCQ